MNAWFYRAFGLTLRSTFPLPGLPPLADPRGSDVIALRLVSEDVVAASWSGRGEHRPTLLVCDDELVRIERGVAGDHHFSYGRRARFHLAADRRAILCAPRDLDDPRWVRLLLDTVLHSTSVLCGYEALHGSCVAIDGRALAVVADSGGGKSTLAAELLRRGGALVCDDILAIDVVDGLVTAHPGPPVVNLPREAWGRSLSADRATLLAALGDECWVSMAATQTDPLPLAGVFLLDRRDGLEARVAPAAPTLIELLRHGLLPVGGPVEGRDRRRFDLFGRLATTVPAFRVEAPLEAPPSDLADLVLDCVAGAGEKIPEAV